MGRHTTFHLSDNGERSYHSSLCLGMVCLGYYHILSREKCRKETDILGCPEITDILGCPGRKEMIKDLEW